MIDYTELVKALRCENTGDDECGSSDCPYWSGLGCMDGQLMGDAAAAIEALQADIKRLKEANDELREAQTYIDHYGDRWLTSAKDVPTAAYEHGYADGRDEAEAQLPKQGKWVGVSPTVDTVQCSICGGQLFSAELETPYCPYCGAKMNNSNASNASNALNALDNAHDGLIVRCGECKHWMDIDNGRQKHEMCAQLMPNWFCADGERKVQE